MKTILIWGAGRIGRGFVADLFDEAGYGLVFVDQSEALVEQLLRQGRYTVVHAEGVGCRTDRTIGNFVALPTSDADAVSAAVVAADLVAIAVFPQDFASVASQLAMGLRQRQTARPEDALDILVCTNLPHAGPIFGAKLTQAVEPGMRLWLDAYVGIVETLVIRMVVEPPPEALIEDPLVVWTNGYQELPVDRQAFRRGVPDVRALRSVGDMRAEEVRKLYTYNTFHAALAYLGALRGHAAIVDCLADSAVRVDAEGALQESCAALRAEFGFGTDEMARWLAGVVAQTDNPALRDTVTRYGADPGRKVQRGDRLMGPLLLARKHAIATPHLTRALAAAYLYGEAADPGAQAMQKAVHVHGITETVNTLSGLNDDEADIAEAVIRAYARLAEERTWAGWVRQAEQLGFAYEQRYHGCGQCTVAALLDTLRDVGAVAIDPCAADAVFEAATGLAGGLGLAGDGPCGGLTGAALVFGLLYPRRRANFDGDRDNKYRTYAMVQRMLQRYLDTYGGISCHVVQAAIMGRAYNLRDSEDRRAFEGAGAHENKCTGVVGRAVGWAMEIIGEEMLGEV